MIKAVIIGLFLAVVTLGSFWNAISAIRYVRRKGGKWPLE